MHYIDRVYGKQIIDEPVILELLNSPSLQRLRAIDVGGYRPLWAKQVALRHEEDHSRFAHSVGVYLLLREYGASLEEQIAGLIHDVSHSAFSHCIDYVLPGGSEKEHSHQDSQFERFVLQSELPGILKKHGFSVKECMDDSRFPLKERSLPDLCADRIDYSIRTAVVFQERTDKEIRSLLSSLEAHGDQWVFSSFESAKEYAELFCCLNRFYWAGFASAVMFRAVGDCMKYALNKGYISESDLYTTDKEVLLRVEPYVQQDALLEKLWQRMNGVIRATNTPDSFESEVYCKSRVVDPLWISEDGVKRVSDVDIAWANLLQEELQPKRYFISF